MALILVVDDDPQIRKFISQVLVRAGHETIVACDGNDCMKAFISRPVDLVITDIIMPEKEGIETIIALRRVNPKVRIIAISGGGRVGPESYLLTAKGLGAAESLQKPFSTEELIAAVDRVLAS